MPDDARQVSDDNVSVTSSGSKPNSRNDPDLVERPARLDIIIVNWNTRDLLSACLRSIFAHPPAVASEIWVVDNASGDGSAKMVRSEFPGARLIANDENVGFATANNQAFVRAAGKYVLLLNSDTEVPAGALDALCAFMDDHPKVGVVGPQLVYPNGRLQDSHGGFPTLAEQLAIACGFGRVIEARLKASGGDGVARQVDYVAGACMLVRREATVKVGLLDERYFMYSEETDWCYRIQQAGWTVWFLPAVRVMHVRGASFGQARPEMLVQLYRSRILFFRKHQGEWTARAAKTIMALDALLRMVGYPAKNLLRKAAGDPRPPTRRAWDYELLLKSLASF